MGLFSDLFSSKPAEDAAQAKIAGLNSGLTSANTALDTGLNTATGLYGQAQVPFTNLATKYGANASAYDDATGVNGAEGLARAKAAFTSTPGYDSGIDMAINKNDRLNASRGILASGNTIADTTKLATDYADQNYGNYVSRLLPGFSADLSASTTGATGQAGVLNNEAAANLGVGNSKAQFGYNTASGIGNANADADMAKYNASQNFWSALAGGAKLATAFI